MIMEGLALARPEYWDCYFPVFFIPVNDSRPTVLLDALDSRLEQIAFDVYRPTGWLLTKGLLQQGRI